MHPGVLAGEQRFTTEEAISYETIASVEESKKPVSFTATGAKYECASCKNLRADLTAIASILIPEVIAEGKGFTTRSLLDAARKAHDKPEPEKHYDEQAMEGLTADQDDAKAKVVAKRIVNVLCHGTTCLIRGRDEQVEQFVLSALRNVDAELAAEKSENSTDWAMHKPNESVEPTIEMKLEVLRRHSRLQEDSIRKLEAQLGPGGVWLALKGLEASVNRNIERLKSQEESVQRALIRVHKNAHEINLMKNDLYPLEHPRRKAVDESEDSK